MLKARQKYYRTVHRLVQEGSLGGQSDLPFVAILSDGEDWLSRFHVLLENATVCLGGHSLGRRADVGFSASELEEVETGLYLGLLSEKELSQISKSLPKDRRFVLLTAKQNAVPEVAAESLITLSEETFKEKVSSNLESLYLDIFRNQLSHSNRGMDSGIRN